MVDTNCCQQLQRLPRSFSKHLVILESFLRCLFVAECSTKSKGFVTIIQPCGDPYINITSFSITILAASLAQLRIHLTTFQSHGHLHLALSDSVIAKQSALCDHQTNFVFILTPRRLTQKLDISYWTLSLLSTQKLTFKVANLYVLEVVAFENKLSIFAQTTQSTEFDYLGNYCCFEQIMNIICYSCVLGQAFLTANFANIRIW